MMLFIALLTIAVVAWAVEQTPLDYDNLDQAFLNNERLYRGQSVEHDEILTEFNKALSDLDKLRGLARSLQTRLEIEVSGHFDPAQDPLLHESKELLERLDRDYDL